MTWMDRVNQNTTVDEAVRKYPSLAEFFIELGYRESCRDCALAALAHRIQMKPQDLVAKVNEFLAKGEQSGRTL